MTEINVARSDGRSALSARDVPFALAALSASDDAAAEGRGHGDTRFRDLLGPDAWRRLPAVVRHRFSVAVQHGASRVFVGEVMETRLTRVGRSLAQLARLAGGLLPTTDGATGPATVVVTEDHTLGGQIWTRTYARPGRFPQTISSVKRFGGPTGLEEYLGFGLVMRLALGVEEGDLVFRSNGYDITLFGRRFALPGWMSPGVCTIRHRALGPERFAFTLALDHPRFGRMASQVCVFTEVRT